MGALIKLIARPCSAVDCLEPQWADLLSHECSATFRKSLRFEGNEEEISNRLQMWTADECAALVGKRNPSASTISCTCPALRHPFSKMTMVQLTCGGRSRRTSFKLGGEVQQDLLLSGLTIG
jgi:hypothetical protein